MKFEILDIILLLYLYIHVGSDGDDVPVNNVLVNRSCKRFDTLQRYIPGSFIFTTSMRVSER